MAKARRTTTAGCGARAVLGLALLAGPAAAQNGEGAAAPTRGELVLLDQVVAMVGDAVILRSTLEESFELVRRQEELDLGRELRPEERQRLQRELLDQLINRHCLAQAAKTLGILTPAQVEQWFQAQMEELEREQVRQLGSYNALSRELALSNQTWQSFERTRRLEKMSQLTEELTVAARLRENHRLLITPKMMRDYYEDNRHLFVYGPRVDLAQVAFPVRRSRALAEQKAKEAAEVWRAEELTASELAERFSDYAVAQPLERGLSEEDGRGLQSFFVEFALEQPAGSVSDPIESEGIFWLLKVAERREGRNQPFSDADVQKQIRSQLERLVGQSLRLQAIERSRRRTHVWYPNIWIR